jgi:hypothetical protein
MLEERARAREGAVGCDNGRRRWRRVCSATKSQFKGGSRKKGERKKERKRKGTPKKRANRCVTQVLCRVPVSAFAVSLAKY